MTDDDLQIYQERELSEKLSGTPISKLRDVGTIGDNDLFLIAHADQISSLSSDAYILREYFDGRIMLDPKEGGAFLLNEEGKDFLSGEMSSFAIEYHDLCSQTVEKVKKGLNLGSMAFEDKNDYSLVDHVHDDVYDRFDIGGALSDETQKYWNIMTVKVSNWTEDGKMTVKTVDINVPAVDLSNVNVFEIGTLKFFGLPEFDDSNIRQYGDIPNVDIDSEDFDGWVFPNGAVFTVDEGRFSEASEIYAVEPQETGKKSFKVPDFRNFLKMNPGTERENSTRFVKFNNGLPPHSHEIQGVTVSGQPKTPKIKELPVGEGGSSGYYDICGYGSSPTPTGKIDFEINGNFDSGQIENAKSTESGSSLDVESKPTHIFMPVMVYIGVV